MILIAIVCVLLLASCSFFYAKPSYIVETFEQTPSNQISSAFERSEMVISITHHKMSDRTWMANDNIYKYRISVKGKTSSDAKEEEFLILSNKKDISFDQAFSSIWSSNTKDFFDPHETIIVGTRYR